MWNFAVSQGLGRVQYELRDLPRSLDPTDRNLPGFARLVRGSPPRALKTRRHTLCLTLTGKGCWASGVIGVLMATLRVVAHTLVAHFCKRVRDCQLETTS
jgi:hypothetical protein